MRGLVLAVCLAMPSATLAQPVLRVTDDSGGPLPARLMQIARLSARGTQVVIGPGVCLSSCTMLLGLRGACVRPDARLGFHGPTSQLRGIGLGPAAFETWSVRIAAHYPRPLRDWYLESGRYRLTGFHMMTGAEVIALGARACDGP